MASGPFRDPCRNSKALLDATKTALKKCELRDDIPVSSEAAEKKCEKLTLALAEAESAHNEYLVSLKIVASFTSVSASAVSISASF